MNYLVKKELSNGFKNPNVTVVNQSQSKPSMANANKGNKGSKNNKKKEVSMNTVISLVQMGFAEEAAFNAVRDAGNFDEALDILSANPFYEGGHNSQTTSHEESSVDIYDSSKKHDFWNDPKNVCTKCFFLNILLIVVTLV